MNSLFLNGKSVPMRNLCTFIVDVAVCSKENTKKYIISRSWVTPVKNLATISLL